MTTILLSIALAAATSAPAKPVVTPEQAAAIEQAERRGQLMFAYDRAAWIGTDDLKSKMPDFASRIGGWIVDGPAGAPQLVFYDRDAAQPHALYIADFRDLKLVSSHLVTGGASALSPARRALVAARASAVAALVKTSSVQRCTTATFNTLVLPPERAGDMTHVYVMTPQTDASVYPFGTHYLIDVDAGGRAGPVQPFTRSCIAVPRADKGKQAVALTISDVLHPTPTEIHVFTSYSARLPVVVLTTASKRAWVVVGKQVSPLPPPKGAPPTH